MSGKLSSTKPRPHPCALSFLILWFQKRRLSIVVGSQFLCGTQILYRKDYTDWRRHSLSQPIVSQLNSNQNVLCSGPSTESNKRTREWTLWKVNGSERKWKDRPVVAQVSYPSTLEVEASVWDPALKRRNTMARWLLTSVLAFGKHRWADPWDLWELKPTSFHS